MLKYRFFFCVCCEAASRKWKIEKSDILCSYCLCPCLLTNELLNPQRVSIVTEENPFTMVNATIRF